MTCDSVVFLDCCGGGFDRVSPCIQEGQRTPIKLFPLSCDMWHNLGVFPSGLYVLCRSGKESAPALLGFLWRVPAGIWGIRPILFLDQWSRICFLGEVSGKANVILVYCFLWHDSEAQPKPEGVSLTLDPCFFFSYPIWGDLGTSKPRTSSMEMFFENTSRGNSAAQRTFQTNLHSVTLLSEMTSFIEIVPDGLHAIALHIQVSILHMPLYGERKQPCLPGVNIWNMQNVEDMAAIIRDHAERNLKGSIFPARAGAATLWRPVQSCMDALLQHHCTPTHPPNALPSLGWWCQELMMTTSSQWGICRKKKTYHTVTTALPLFNVSSFLGWRLPRIIILDFMAWASQHLTINSSIHKILTFSFSFLFVCFFVF